MKHKQSTFTVGKLVINMLVAVISVSRWEAVFGDYSNAISEGKILRAVTILEITNILLPWRLFGVWLTLPSSLKEAQCSCFLHGHGVLVCVNIYVGLWGLLGKVTLYDICRQKCCWRIAGFAGKYSGPCIVSVCYWNMLSSTNWVSSDSCSEVNWTLKMHLEAT